ncbi:hypothetical protein [Fischerella sp. PCC 9605]|nr:hypothetical protein [Fischerella sp. PCC 9605]
MKPSLNSKIGTAKITRRLIITMNFGARAIASLKALRIYQNGY